MHFFEETPHDMIMKELNFLVKEVGRMYLKAYPGKVSQLDDYAIPRKIEL